MVPTRSVIQHASLSIALNRPTTSLWTFLSGFRPFLNWAREIGFGDFTTAVSLITEPHP